MKREWGMSIFHRDEIQMDAMVSRWIACWLFVCFGVLFVLVLVFFCLWFFLLDFVLVVSLGGWKWGGSRNGSLLKNFVIHDLKSHLEFQSWNCPYQSHAKNKYPLHVSIYTSESGRGSAMINLSKNWGGYPSDSTELLQILSTRILNT